MRAQIIIACLCVGLLAGMALAAYLWHRPSARCPNPEVPAAAAAARRRILPRLRGITERDP
jgi:hypothetical protein